MPEGFLDFESLPDFIKQKLSDMVSPEKEWEALGPLSPEDLKEWQDFKSKKNELERAERTLKAKRTLFWARIEEGVAKEHRDDNMTIRDGVLYIEKKEKKERVELPPIHDGET